MITGPASRLVSTSRVVARLLLVATAGSGMAVRAQNADTSNASSQLTDELPRPGYEPRTLRLGSIDIATSLSLETRYDSNVFAAARRPADDLVLILSPRLRIDGGLGNVKLRGDIHADTRNYASNGSEDHVDFGVGASGSYTIDRRNSLQAAARADRFAESRNDPDANVGRTLSPRLVDALEGRLGYDFEGNRFGLSLSGEVRRLDYRLPEDSDRSLTSTQASARFSLLAFPSLALFARPYVNRRDFDQAVDDSGIDRDATTLGVILGARLSGTGRWSGQAGIGAFRSNPDDPSLRSFSGFAASADLTWTPRRRTVFTLRGFSGDVATVRAGAIGRTDARISLKVDQEIRHNLLFGASAGYQHVRYRGLSNESRTLFAAAQTEYLVNRTVGLFLDVSYARRRANPSTDNFNRSYVGVGIRLRR